MKKVRLGDVATVITKGTTPTSLGYDFIENGINFVKIESITEDGDFIKDKFAHITDECNEKLNRSQLQENDILFSIAGAIGRVAIVDKSILPANTNQALAIIRVPKGIYEYNFLKYILKSPVISKQFEKQKQGVAQINLSLKNISDFEIPVISLEQQRQVSHVLDKVTDLINKRKQQLSKLDELVKARFVELFGDPKLNNKGWKSGVISDYFEVKGGKRIPKGMGYSDTKTNHPYLRATDMKNETILEDDIHYISEEVFQHIKRYTVKGGDIYLTNVGVNLGMAGVIPQKFDGASLTENAVKLVPKTEKEIDGMFLAHYINSPGIQEYINERKMAVGVPKLAIFRIETMPLLIPPMEVQQDFIAFVKQTDKSKLEVQKSLEKLELLKKALMQKYFG
ncbi:MAG: restriction endonuclease subunit S [Oscillospiraceae bacterium]|nr:restriction endonuclease subunit S [Oscillospiraceae bacterium]